MTGTVETTRSRRILRFGTFELDVAGGALRRRGLRVHLQEMPLQVLLMLLEQPGELVRRDDFYTRLWPNDALGILDDNLNTAVGKLRVALDDSPRNPRFIETVPRRGYRFIAPVTSDDAASPTAAVAASAPARSELRAPPSQDAAPRRTSSLFVGRAREMEELRGALMACRGGRRHVVIVAGEAGIGKTRIAEELAGEADALGAKVLWGRSLEEHGGQPYLPWVQILRALIQSSGDDVLREEMGACAADIAAIVPELCARLGVAPPDTLKNAEHERYRLFDSITEYLRRAARRRPLMLVFDNLHWSGKPSLLLLEFVAQSLVDSPVLIAGTYRGSEVSRHHPLFDTLAALNRESGFLRLQLRGLTLEAVGDMLERSCGAPWPGVLVKSLHAQTEGNPFFVSEVAQLLVEERAVVPGAGSMQPASGGALVIRIPEGIREVVCKRLNRLSPECSAMLSRAAVIGREFEIGVLRLLLDDLCEDALTGTLAEALASGTIAEAGVGTGRYRFTHALIKETLYDEICPAHRPGYHARAGEMLERVHGTDPEPWVTLLAHQYAKAAGDGCAAQAVKYCVRAAEKAESLLAYEEAIGWYEMALDALEREATTDEATKCRLLLAAARSLSKAGRVPETIDHVQRAAECARRLGDVDALVDACRVIDYIVANVGVAGSQALPLIEETVSALGEQESATRAALLGALTRAAYSAGMPLRAEAAMRESLAMARRVGDPKALVSALRARLYARDPSDDLDQRLAAAREMLHVAETIGDREAQREAHDMCFYDLIEKGEVEAADEHLNRAGEVGRVIRQPFHAHNHMIYRTMRMVLQGRYEEGERLAREALDAGLRLRCESAEGIFGMQMFTIRRDQGRLGELAGALSAFTRERSVGTTWRPGLALMYSELGRADEARSELEHLSRDDYVAIPRDVLWPTCLAYLVEVAAFLGDRQRAAELYELLQPYDGHTLIVGSCVACLGASSHYLAMMARCLGRPDDAARHFEDALALNTRIGARPWLARTQLRLGTLLLERKSAADRARGRELLHAALASARALGMTSLEQRANAAQAAPH